MNAVEQTTEAHEAVSVETYRLMEAQCRMYKAALESIVGQAGEHIARMPDAKNVPYNLALGGIMTLSGLAQAVLED